MASGNALSCSAVAGSEQCRPATSQSKEDPLRYPATLAMLRGARRRDNNVLRLLEFKQPFARPVLPRGA
eukprot:scaffold1442_cov38-Prasinocladus_malaysianus.AAC.1